MLALRADRSGPALYRMWVPVCRAPVAAAHDVFFVVPFWVVVVASHPASNVAVAMTITPFKSRVLMARECGLGHRMSMPFVECSVMERELRTTNQRCPSACSGSRFAARRAGNQQATRARAATQTATLSSSAASLTADDAPKPRKNGRMVRLQSTPAASDHPIKRAPCLTRRRQIADLSAPSARRIPISCRRCATE